MAEREAAGWQDPDARPRQSYHQPCRALSLNCILRDARSSADLGDV
jgi:hypothetical protein